jgi:hypothetical protein
VEGLGVDPTRLVEKAIDERPRDDYDQVWCVFDRDEVPAERFNRALALAKKEKIRVAYSNPAVELWFLLHFQECTGALTRHDCARRLSAHLKQPYDKTDPQLFLVLERRQKDALARAERLLASYAPHRPAADNPATTVYLLVHELLRFHRP